LDGVVGVVCLLLVVLWVRSYSISDQIYWTVPGYVHVDAGLLRGGVNIWISDVHGIVTSKALRLKAIPASDYAKYPVRLVCQRQARTKNLFSFTVLVPCFIWLVFGRTQSINETNATGIYSFHTSGANVGFADGSVRLVSDNIDQDTLNAMATRASGDTVKPE
jgi:prepilin-type processing-associated H-X9-DG protein